MRSRTRRPPGRSELIDGLVAAGSIEELQERAQRTRATLLDMHATGAAPTAVITLHADLVDNVVRRALQLVFARHPGLSLDVFTWLSLGSNGRRETVPSSDLDAAVAFDDRVSSVELAQYREVFGEVIAVLADAGLRADSNGVKPSSWIIARTNGRWRAAGRQWLASPLDHNGAMMTSLLVDARPIHGDPGLPAVARVFGDLPSTRARCGCCWRNPCPSGPTQRPCATCSAAATPSISNSMHCFRSSTSRAGRLWPPAHSCCPR